MPILMHKIAQAITAHKLRGKFTENEILAPHTSWHVGGPARYFYQPADLQDLTDLLHLLQSKGHPPAKDSLQIIILGAGSNVLISDAGIDGLVISTRGCLNQLQQLDDFNLRAEAGVSCSRLVQQGIHLGMIDIAFLAGIPGTVGGALAMNAGAFGDEIWKHVTMVETIDRAGVIKERDASEFEVGYRLVNGLHEDEWFVAANLTFARQDEDTARKLVQDLLHRRQATQPWNELTCGSVFRNPPGDYAARLIESCGLKGMHIGKAKVSEKHANFIVNEGGASATEIEQLIREIQRVVEAKFGVALILEVHLLP